MSNKNVSLVQVMVHCQTQGKLSHTTSFDVLVHGPKKVKRWNNKEAVSTVLQKLFRGIGEKVKNRLHNPEHNLIIWQEQWTEAVFAEAEVTLRNQKRTLEKKGFTVLLRRGEGPYPNYGNLHMFALHLTNGSARSR